MSQWDPDSYRRVNNLQQLVAERALADLVLEGDERVLDVGCGDGKVTAMIAARLTTGTVVGVDPSAKMIDAAKQLLPDTSRSTFMVGTAAALTFHPSFDLVTSFNALHWEIRWLEALQRIRSALRPNGRALLVFVCDGERPSLEDVVTQACRSSRWKAAFNDFAAPFAHVDPDAYAAAAGSVGFAVDRLVVDDLEWDFGTRAAFADWCTAGLVAWTGRLASDDRADFVDDVISAYAEVSGSDTRFRFLETRRHFTLRCGRVRRVGQSPPEQRIRSAAAAEGGDLLEVRLPAVGGVDVEGGCVEVDGVEGPGHREVLGVGVSCASRLGSHSSQRALAGQPVGGMAADDPQYRQVGQRLEPSPPQGVLEPRLGDECYLGP